MRLILIFLAAIIFPTVSVGQLSYANIPLTWSDFTPSDNVGGLYTACVSCKLKYKISPRQDSGNTSYYLASDIHIDRSQTRVAAKFIKNAAGFEKDKLLRHEKGHLILFALQHARFVSIVSSFHFTSSFQQELDSIFSTTLTELKASNISYDNETNHGLYASQETWEQKLMLQLEQVCKSEHDIFNPVNTPLYFKNPFFKLNDPISYNYEDAKVILDYPFASADVSIDKVTPFVVKKEAPFAGQVDSMLGVTGVDFTKNFEIELSLLSDTKNEKEGIALFWAIEAAAQCMGIVISAAKIKYTYCKGGDHKKDERKNFTLKRKMKETRNLLSLRHVDDKYFIFINGRFDREFPYRSLPGRKLLIAPLKKGNACGSLKIISLK